MAQSKAHEMIAIIISIVSIHLALILGKHYTFIYTNDSVRPIT